MNRFWYSQKAFEHFQLWGKEPLFVKLDTGDTVLFTEQNDKPDPASVWPDQKYLGTGTFAYAGHRTEGKTP